MHGKQAAAPWRHQALSFCLSGTEAAARPAATAAATCTFKHRPLAAVEPPACLPLQPAAIEPFPSRLLHTRATPDQVMEAIERAVLLTTANDITRAAVDHGHVRSGAGRRGAVVLWGLRHCLTAAACPAVLTAPPAVCKGPFWGSAT